MIESKPHRLESGKFTLWELLVFSALVACTAALYSWSREEPDFWFLTIICASTTIAFAIRVITRCSRSAASSVAIGLCILAALLAPLVNAPRRPARRMQCSNHLKQIGLGLQNYHDIYGSFPPAYFADSSGKPIHSWRVLILPFIEQKTLYDKYRFEEPWDGPNNRKLHRAILEVYRCPSRSTKRPASETSYVVVMGYQTMWPYEKATKVTDIADGTSNTIMVVEMLNSGIHWMEPRDLDMATMTSVLHAPNAACISSPHPKAALVVFVDGHTQALTAGVSDTVAEALLTIAGGEKIDPDE